MGADEQEITEPLTTGELVYERKMLLWGMPSAVKTCSEEMSASLSISPMWKWPR